VAAYIRYLEANADMPAKIIFTLTHSCILTLYRTDIFETTTMCPDITQHHYFSKHFTNKVTNA